MSLIVQKYGGTSVGTPELICSVARKIQKDHLNGNSLVVVVSAMGQTTDELLSLSQKVSLTPTQREMDMLLTAGERISMSLLSMALSDIGVSAISLTGSQTGIITDTSHRRARIKRILGDRVREGLANGKVVIVAGFQGVSESKDVTTLGRGGSDTTAVALAAALHADRCEIYTDVNGFYSADPRKIPNAKLWTNLSYDLSLEMAYLGAAVLHPRCLEIAKKYQIKVSIKNSFDKDQNQKGSNIMEFKKNDQMEMFKLVGVTLDEEKCPIKVKLGRPTAAGSVLDCSTKVGLVVMAPFFSGNDLVFYVDQKALNEWKKHLDFLLKENFIERYDCLEDWVPISVVGECFSQDGRIFYTIIETLNESSIEPLFGASSALSFTCAVLKTHSDRALDLLHKKLIEFS